MIIFASILYNPHLMYHYHVNILTYLILYTMSWPLQFECANDIFTLL